VGTEHAACSMRLRGAVASHDYCFTLFGRGQTRISCARCIAKVVAQSQKSRKNRKKSLCKNVFIVPKVLACFAPLWHNTVYLNAPIIFSYTQASLIVSAKCAILAMANPVRHTGNG
jgi:hypothetical protein